MFSYCYWQEKYLLTRLIVKIPGWIRGYGSHVVNRQIKLPLKTMKKSDEAATSYELKKMCCKLVDLFLCCLAITVLAYLSHMMSGMSITQWNISWLQTKQK